jgi:hypothetical protein
MDHQFTADGPGLRAAPEHHEPVDLVGHDHHHEPRLADRVGSLDLRPRSDSGRGEASITMTESTARGRSRDYLDELSKLS